MAVTDTTVRCIHSPGVKPTCSPLYFPSANLCPPPVYPPSTITLDSVVYPSQTKGKVHPPRKDNSTRKQQVKGKQPWSTPPQTPRRSKARHLRVYVLRTCLPGLGGCLWRPRARSDACGVRFVLLASRSEGNEFFKRQDYANAIQKYSEAIELDGSNHVYYSNRRCVYLDAFFPVF